MELPPFSNPFRPGAGHPPPFLAGREKELQSFSVLLEQRIILKNLILTGLRGVGKTVLLDRFKPLAIEKRWLWAGTDLSETSSLTESNLATRLLADLSKITSNIQIRSEFKKELGFIEQTEVKYNRFDYDTLCRIFERTPGLIEDKLKFIFEHLWSYLQEREFAGIIFAYDEAQNLSDHAQDKEYPLSVLLSVFQSLQRKELPFMLVLTGLPTLYPKLVKVRTYTERMFQISTLGKLDREASRQAIVKPIEKQECPVTFNDSSITTIIDVSGGYPYFIQFICREVFDVIIQRQQSAEQFKDIELSGIIYKLDEEFFAGRYANTTDRQRDILECISSLENASTEFSTQEVIEMSKKYLGNAVSASHITQILAALVEAGLIFKHKHGRYSLAVPLLDKFIQRQKKLRTHTL